MKHPKRCSYTIPKSPPEDKQGAVAKAWANKVLFRTKVCSRVEGISMKEGGAIGIRQQRCLLKE